MRHRLICIFVLAASVPYVQAQPFYPVIAKTEQKARDEDRRLILQAELAAEREALVKAKAMPDSSAPRGDESAVHRHEENIKALQRELDGHEVQESTDARQRITVRALRPATGTGNAIHVPRFWDPYNRAVDVNDLSTNQRSESHE